MVYICFLESLKSLKNKPYSGTAAAIFEERNKNHLENAGALSYKKSDKDKLFLLAETERRLSYSGFDIF